MKAVIYNRYGPADVLQLKEVEKPVPKENEVLIKVHATTVTAVDCTFRKGDSFHARLFTGLLRPKHTTPGGDLAGEIEAVGSAVKRFKQGDQIFASMPAGFGSHAQYVCLPEDSVLALKPAGIDYAQAASAPYGTLTALPFLRDTAQVGSGQQVLINGASGSIGTFAVQLAKNLGAEVTGVCSKANVELVQSLGADKVLDYTTTDFTKTGRTYDIIFDTVGKSSFTACKNCLSPHGIYLSPVLTPSILWQMAWTSKIGSKKAKITFTGLRPPVQQRQDLLMIKKLMEEGKLKPVIDRTYPLEEIVEAHKYVEKGHKKGNAVITL